HCTVSPSSSNYATLEAYTPRYDGLGVDSPCWNGSQYAQEMDHIHESEGC
ncbi:Hypothetical protein FKW44_017571, partial [Caligus rogercresseyi]